MVSRHGITTLQNIPEPGEYGTTDFLRAPVPEL
jgi:hypothetical protein